MLEDILIKVIGDEKLATKFLGATSPFPDVRNDQYFFNAAMTVTSRGFLEADKATGEFKPGDPVSGADALLVDSRVQEPAEILIQSTWPAPLNGAGFFDAYDNKLIHFLIVTVRSLSFAA